MCVRQSPLLFFSFLACVSASQPGCHVNDSLFALTAYYSILSIPHTSLTSFCSQGIFVPCVCTPGPTVSLKMLFSCMPDVSAIGKTIAELREHTHVPVCWLIPHHFLQLLYFKLSSAGSWITKEPCPPHSALMFLSSINEKCILIHIFSVLFIYLFLSSRSGHLCFLFSKIFTDSYFWIICIFPVNL